MVCQGGVSHKVSWRLLFYYRRNAVIIGISRHYVGRSMDSQLPGLKEHAEILSKSDADGEPCAIFVLFLAKLCGVKELSSTFESVPSFSMIHARIMFIADTQLYISNKTLGSSNRKKYDLDPNFMLKHNLRRGDALQYGEQETVRFFLCVRDWVVAVVVVDQLHMIRWTNGEFIIDAIQWCKGKVEKTALPAETDVVDQIGTNDA